MSAQIKVKDDTGFIVELPSPPARIISLAPHITEILFSLGVRDKIVGTVRFSDYPSKQCTIPVLGDAFAINLESILSLGGSCCGLVYAGGANTTVSKIEAKEYLFSSIMPPI